MFAYVRGPVTGIGRDYALVDINGFGIKVYTTSAVLASLTEGEEIKLETSFIVKEDSQTLYGFEDPIEQKIFDILIGVSGVGPRIGLAILNTHSVEVLATAVQQGNDSVFSQVSGIGPKGAKKIVLELSGKLDSHDLNMRAEAVDAPQFSLGSSAWELTVKDALSGLGWKEQHSQTTIEEFKAKEPELAEDGDTAKILKTILKSVGNSKTVVK